MKETTILFGRNRRQHPVRIVTPGGSVTITREFGGTVRIDLRGDAGSIVPGVIKEHAGEVRIVYSEREQEAAHA